MTLPPTQPPGWYPDPWGEGALSGTSMAQIGGPQHRLPRRRRYRRPQDCELIDGYTGRVESWTPEAVEVLGDKPPEVALRLPCPVADCGKRFVYRLSAGERVRSSALRVSESGARCLACGATWPVDRLEFLAKLLGCPALPG